MQKGLQNSLGNALAGVCASVSEVRDGGGEAHLVHDGIYAVFAGHGLFIRETRFASVFAYPDSLAVGRERSNVVPARGQPEESNQFQGPAGEVICVPSPTLMLERRLEAMKRHPRGRKRATPGPKTPMSPRKRCKQRQAKMASKQSCSIL